MNDALNLIESLTKNAKGWYSSCRPSIKKSTGKKVTLNLGLVYPRTGRPIPKYSVATSKNVELFEACKKLMQYVDPNFHFTSIFIGKGIRCDWHVDKRNSTHSYAFSIGEQSSYDVEFENGSTLNYFRNPKKFDGTVLHRTNPNASINRIAFILYSI